MHFVTLFRNVDTNPIVRRGRTSIISGPVTYGRDESVAVITMDDGKVNALGPTMQQALNEALDEADRDDVGAVVIAGTQVLAWMEPDLITTDLSAGIRRGDRLPRNSAGLSVWTRHPKSHRGKAHQPRIFDDRDGSS